MLRRQCRTPSRGWHSTLQDILSGSVQSKSILFNFVFLVRSTVQLVQKPPMKGRIQQEKTKCIFVVSSKSNVWFPHQLHQVDQVPDLDVITNDQYLNSQRRRNKVPSLLMVLLASHTKWRSTLILMHYTPCGVCQALSYYVFWSCACVFTGQSRKVSVSSEKRKCDSVQQSSNMR